jgi:hypothetical protein
MEHNKFLQQFLKARESMTAAQTKPSAKAKASENPKTTLITIIEDCPPKSKVLEYLRQRIEELEEDEL